jgi:hypothetical protein
LSILMRDFKQKGIVYSSLQQVDHE